MKVLSIAALGMRAQEENVRVIADNIANSSTTAFAPGSARLSDLKYARKAVPQPGPEAGDGLEYFGSGVRVSAIQRDFSQGALQETGRPLDLAINGPGFFKLAFPDGRAAYARAGTFQLSKDGEIVHSNGLPLSSAITIPEEHNEIYIDQAGNVFSRGADSDVSELQGTIELVNFAEPNGLRPAGDNMYAFDEAAGDEIDIEAGNDSFLQQGYLETSGVDTVRELTELIRAQRMYELNSRVIRTADAMLSAQTQIIG